MFLGNSGVFLHSFGPRLIYRSSHPLNMIELKVHKMSSHRVDKRA